MKAWILTILFLGGMAAGCSQKPASSSSATNTTSTDGNPLTAPVDYIGAVGKAQKLAEKTTVTVSIEKAIQAFFAGEDRYPNSLNELVTSQYLPVLPAPPRGMQYIYNPSTGQVGVRSATPPAASTQPSR